MRLFIENGDHFRFLRECVGYRPRKVVIASFGIYAGILADGRDTQEWGERYKSTTRELLNELLNVPQVEILVGLGEYKSCKGKLQCLDCERQYTLGLIRLMNHAEKFPNFTWRVTTQSHIKCTLFFYDDKPSRGTAGSRNFTDSNWAEVTVELDEENVTRLEEHVRKVWKGAKLLSDKILGEMLEEQGISQLAIDAVLAGSD